MSNKALFNILLPILYVGDLEAEKNFYNDLGFTISYEGDDFPGFIGLAFRDTIEFGLQQKEGFDPSKINELFVWQIGCESLKTVLDICKKKGFEIIETPTIVKKEWDLHEIRVKSPNGYEVVFEGPMNFKKERIAKSS